MALFVTYTFQGLTLAELEVLETAVGKPQASNSVYPVAPDEELRGKVQSSLRTLTGPDALRGPPLAAIGFSMTLEAREVFRDLLHAAIGLADRDGDWGRGPSSKRARTTSRIWTGRSTRARGRSLVIVSESVEPARRPRVPPGPWR